MRLKVPAYTLKHEEDETQAACGYACLSRLRFLSSGPTSIQITAQTAEVPAQGALFVSFFDCYPFHLQLCSLYEASPFVSCSVSASSTFIH